ncbi:unnamed protein product [Orchesella dallaii]|uniref:Uncharacterized protein n=1 Tax=Orchesella dallaii TaxID=48710 RepID=A0ABP1R0P2_9HEXA
MDRNSEETHQILSPASLKHSSHASISYIPLRSSTVDENGKYYDSKNDNPVPNLESVYYTVKLEESMPSISGEGDSFSLSQQELQQNPLHSSGEKLTSISATIIPPTFPFQKKQQETVRIQVEESLGSLIQNLSRDHHVFIKEIDSVELKEGGKEQQPNPNQNQVGAEVRRNEAQDLVRVQGEAGVEAEVGMEVEVDAREFELRPIRHNWRILVFLLIIFVLGYHWAYKYYANRDALPTVIEEM